MKIKKYTITTPVVFMLLSFLYIYSIALEGLLSSNGLELKFPIYFQDNYLYIKIIVAMLFAQLSFNLGLTLTNFKKLEKDNSTLIKNRKHSYKHDRYLVYTILTLSLILYIVYSKQINQSFTYIGAYETRYNNSIFSFYRTVIFSLLAVASGLCLTKKRNRALGLALVCFLFLLGILFSDKDPMVLAILSLLSSNKIFLKRFKPHKFIIIIMAVIFLAYLSKIYSYYRGLDNILDAISYANNDFMFSKLDGAGPFYSIITVFSEDQDLLLGKSYIIQIINIIPRFIYSGTRPPDIAVLFAMEHLPNWSKGKGMGFSPLAESVMNFGIYGVIIQFFFVAIIWGTMWKYVYQILKKYFNFSVARFLVVYRIIGFYFLLLLFRSPALFFIKTMMFVFIPFFLLLIFINLFIKTTRK